jgi:hypothetical protein
MITGASEVKLAHHQGAISSFASVQEVGVRGRVLGAALACALAAGLGAGSASAHAIDYILTGDADGTMTVGGVTTPFSGSFTLDGTADTASWHSVTNTADFVPLTSATSDIAGFGQETLPVHAGVEFAVGLGHNKGLAAYGDSSGGPFVPSILMTSPAFKGWKAKSSLAPTGLTSLSFDSGYPVTVQFASGDTLEIDSISRPVFSASAPEPAAWAMMILGLGAIGWTARRRRLRTAG